MAGRFRMASQFIGLSWLMCGRYAFITSRRASRLLGLPLDERFQPRYNIAPTQSAPILRANPRGGVELVEARWGLIPRWAKAIPKFPTFNARVESVAEKPSFRQAWKEGHFCLVPAAGIYEWMATPEGKIPHFISRKEGEEMLMAGLWEPTRWEGDERITFTILTGPPNALVARIHDRQAIVLSDETARAWMAPRSLPGPEWLKLLGPGPAEELQAWPVSRAVNSAKEDGPDLIQPVGLPLTY